MTNDRRAFEYLSLFSDVAKTHVIVHYVYFPTAEQATKASASLRLLGFQVEQRLAADGENWLVLAQHSIAPSENALGDVQQLIESICDELNGEYDGWEAEVNAKFP